MRLRCHFQWHKISPVTKVSTQSTCQMNSNWLKYISLKYTGNLLLHTSGGHLLQAHSEHQPCSHTALNEIST
jgi:hypothetical protein